MGRVHELTPEKAPALQRTYCYVPGPPFSRGCTVPVMGLVRAKGKAPLTAAGSLRLMSQEPFGSPPSRGPLTLGS